MATKTPLFSEDIHKAWLKWVKITPESIRDSINVVEDFALSKIEILDYEGSPRAKRRKVSHGIQGIEVGYANQKLYVEKAKDIVDFEREGSCTIIYEELEHDEDEYAICPFLGCESVTHLTCLSQYFQSDEDTLIPISGTCPSCKAELRWIDVVKEPTLRMRGQKQVEVRKGEGSVSQAALDSSVSEDQISEEEEIAYIEAQLRELSETGEHARMRRLEISDSESDTGSIRSNISRVSKQPEKKSTAKLKPIIEDSDWDNVEVLG